MTMNGLMKMPRLFVECWDIGLYKFYSKCSKISKTTCLPKGQGKQGRPRSDCFKRFDTLMIFLIGCMIELGCNLVISP